MLSNDLTLKEFKGYRNSVHKVGHIISEYDFGSFPANPLDSRPEIDGLFLVRGITDEVYSKLNGTFVVKWKDTKLLGRARNSRLEVKKNSNGNDLWRPVACGEGAGTGAYKTGKESSSKPIGVLSTLSLGIPYNYVPTQENLDYVDIWKTREFAYYLPSTSLYRVNMTSLAVSPRRNLRAYYGYSFETWEVGRGYIGVIPYDQSSRNSRRNYVGVKILSTKVGVDWNLEIEAIFQKMYTEGIIPDANIGSYVDGLDLTPVLFSDESMSFSPISSVSLGTTMNDVLAEPVEGAVNMSSEGSNSIFE